MTALRRRRANNPARRAAREKQASMKNQLHQDEVDINRLDPN
jgi:hypothetical protein